MKKLVINIILVLTFFLIYFLQSNLFTWFKIAGVMPNLFVIYILFIVLVLVVGAVDLLISCLIG